jgi:putative hydrolase of the HAD superfamily
VDIGGVLLSNGWDHLARQRAAVEFQLDNTDLEARHGMNSGALEEGKLSLEDYLGRVVFHRRRTFSRARFKKYLFDQSTPFPPMLALVANLKARHSLKVAALSNESRELNAHRIRKFRLGAFVDFFVSSCFVHLRKPDTDIFHLALDLAQVKAGEAAYLENTPLFVQVARGMGMRGILHTDLGSTRRKLASLGLGER